MVAEALTTWLQNTHQLHVSQLPSTYTSPQKNLFVSWQFSKYVTLFINQ